MKKLATAAAAALGGLALVAATQGPAQAAPVVAQAVPGCVKADVTYLVTVMVKITNECSTTQNVKVDYDRDYFSECFTLAPGATAQDSAAVWSASRYEGLVSC